MQQNNYNGHKLKITLEHLNELLSCNGVVLRLHLILIQSSQKVLLPVLPSMECNYRDKEIGDHWRWPQLHDEVKVDELNVEPQRYSVSPVLVRIGKAVGSYEYCKIPGRKTSKKL